MPENIVPVKAEHSFTEEELQSAADYQNWKRTREADAPGHDRRHAPVRREHHPAPRRRQRSTKPTSTANV